MKPKIFDSTVGYRISGNIFHYPTNEKCHYELIDIKTVFNDQDIERMVNVCNQPLIYNRLFKKKLMERKYSAENVYSFLRWAKQGREEQRWFVFIIRNQTGQIAASMDIKSNDLTSSEIGYWCSNDSPGIMTNAITKLCQIAKKMGYKSLYAAIHPINRRSLNLATRCGFTHTGDIDRNNETYLVYSKLL